MNEPKQPKRTTLRDHLNRGVVSVMVATTGLGGCARPPEEELRETAYRAAAACEVSPPPPRGRHRALSTLGTKAVQVSVPCGMARDKPAIDHEVAQAAVVCAESGAGKPGLYQGNTGFIASCTSVEMGTTPPLASALAGSAAPPSAGTTKPEVAVPQKKSPSFAERAASAPPVTQAQR